MSESGHSQPGLYERRRRWNREKELGHQSLSGPGRERDYVPWDRDRDRDRDRRVKVYTLVGMAMRAGIHLKSDLDFIVGTDG